MRCRRSVTGRSWHAGSRFVPGLCGLLPVTVSWRGRLLTLTVLTGVLVLWLAGHAFALPGNVVGQQKISDLAGSFSGTLINNDQFGVSVAHVGDLNGDGKQDIVVGAAFDDDGGTNRGAVWVLFLQTDGTVISHQKISSTAGSFAGALDDGDQFGYSVASVGDLDGDGRTDIAVGAIGDDDGGSNRGAVWILFLNANGTVKGHQKISSTIGGFGGALDNGDNFGSAVASPGDIDGDTVRDLVVGAQLDDDGGTDRGAAWILFLNSNGTVKGHAKISDATAGLAGSLDNSDLFGVSVTGLGDIDADGVPDIAVGAVGDDDGGTDRGAVYVFRLNAAGTIKGTTKISQTSGGFTGTLSDFDQFGSAVVRIPDVNNDGRSELGVGAIGDDDGGTDRGAMWVLFLDSTGTVTLRRKISTSLGGFGGPLANGDFFAWSGVAAKDVNGDGVTDLVVGAPRDDDGGTNRGAVWVLFLDGVPGTFCGDGELDFGEACDDGNKLNGDCCSSTCDYDPPATPCPDNDVCNGNETCNGTGVCDAGAALDCNDGEPCTQDLCHPVTGCSSTSGPAGVCLFAGKSLLDVSDKSPDTKDKLKWRWQKGEQTLFEDFGNPASGTDYTLCVYDTSGNVPSLKASLEIPPGGLWAAKSTKGYTYKDTSAVTDGVKNVQLKSGGTGKAKVSVTATGVNIPMPAPFSMTQFLGQDPEVVVQLINDLGFCWSSTYSAPAATNTVSRFKDKTP
jgi:cysteine-rich repeat protein